MGFLPVCREDMQARGWDAPDFVLVTGRRYVDHPSFGTAVISRVLEAAGFVWRFCRSPIGAPVRRSPRSAVRGWAFSSTRATSIRWLRTIRRRKSAAATTGIRQAARQASGPTAL